MEKETVEKTDEKVEKNTFDFPKVSMRIILAAGEARSCAQRSLEQVRKKEFAKAKVLLGEAKEHIKDAHRSQTEVMQTLAFSEYNDAAEPIVLPMLFMHAQDTLMTIMSEVNMTEQMIEMFMTLEKEISLCRK